MKKSEMFPTEPCHACKGRGGKIIHAFDTEWHDCEECEGTGRQIAGEHGS